MKTFTGWRAVGRAMRWARQQDAITYDRTIGDLAIDLRWTAEGRYVLVELHPGQPCITVDISTGTTYWSGATTDAAELLRVLAALDLIPAELATDRHRQRVCHIAVCDDCGTEYEHDYTPHWPSAGEAADDAADGGEWWSGEGGILLCSHCKIKPHSYLTSKYWSDRCDRCELPEDEHVEVAK